MTRGGCSFRRSSGTTLAEGLVVTRGQERCLTVWPQADFAGDHRAAPRGAAHQQGHPRLRPHAVRGASRGGARQAGPDLHPAGAARVRLAQQDVSRDRRRWTGSRSGTRRAGRPTPRSRRRSSPSSATRSSPASSTTSAPSRTQQPESQDEVSGPLPGHLGHLPRFQRTPPKGAGRDLVRRARHHDHSRQHRGRDHEHRRRRNAARRHGRVRHQGPAPGPSR